MLALLSLLLAASPIIGTPLDKRYSAVLIYSQRRNLCLSTDFIRGPRDGVGVTLVDCASAITWDINPGAGQVRVHDQPSLVLDASYNPGNGGLLQMNTEVPGKSAQNWYLTNDNRVAITGGNQCLDDSGSGLQTWQCTTGNTNQIFFTRAPSGGGGGGGGGGNNPVQPPDIPYGTIYADPANDRRRIHGYSRSDLCATVLGGQARAGAVVGITYCLANDDGRVNMQLWDVTGSASRVGGPVVLASDRNFCLSSPTYDSGPTTLQPCTSAGRWIYDISRQKFYIQSANNFCLDIKAESRKGNESPLNSFRTLQTWTCYNDNPNQQFYMLY